MILPKRAKVGGPGQSSLDRQAAESIPFLAQPQAHAMAHATNVNGHTRETANLRGSETERHPYIEGAAVLFSMLRTVCIWRN